jgi:hypothetical protein
MMQSQLVASIRKQSRFNTDKMLTNGQPRMHCE